MVKCFMILFFPFVLMAQAKLEVLLDQTSYAVHMPVTGTLNVTHDSKEVVDPHSFIYQGKKLEVDYLRKVHFPGPGSLDVESFRFSLPPQPEGLQVLEPISVKVSGKTVLSPEISYEIKKLKTLGKTAQTSPASSKPYLKIETLFEGTEPLYPGMTATVGYRYIYQGDIDLSQEVVPLLDQTLFVKLGEKQIQDFNKGTLSVREITQNIKVEKTGVYEISPATIAGFAYIDGRGRGPKTYLEPKLTSSTEPTKITVAPFPEKNKPPFFNGAIGPLEISTTVQKPPKLELGDKLTFLITFRGGLLSTVKPPNLLCQPGFSGFFQAGDLPPQGEKKEGESTFAYELKPLTRLIELIPSVFFAYFDPEKQNYKILSTEPIPIAIEGDPWKEKIKPPRIEPATMIAEFKVPEKEPPAILLTSKDYAGRPFGGAWVLLLIPVSLLFFWLAAYYREKEEEKKRRPLTVEERLARARKALPDLKAFLAQAEGALRASYKSESLPEPAQNFLASIEEALWGQKKTDKPEIFYERLKELCMQNGNQKPTGNLKIS